MPARARRKHTDNPITAAAIRPARGSGIIAGVAAVFLLICGTVLSVLLLLNTGIALYNKEKLSFIANQAANYAAAYGTTYSDTAACQVDVSLMVSSLLSSMGLHSSNTAVTVTDSKNSVSVTISASLPTLTSSAFASVFPQQAKSTFTASAKKQPYATAYTIALDPLGGQKACGALVNPVGQLPPDGQPAWFITLGTFYQLR